MLATPSMFSQEYLRRKHHALPSGSLHFVLSCITMYWAASHHVLSSIFGARNQKIKNTPDGVL